MARKTKKSPSKRRTVKRRRTHLAGSPEHHRAEATTSARSAVMRYNSARQYAEAGNCTVAFAQFTQGALTEGKAIAHDREAHGPMSVSESGALSDAYLAAEAAMERACVVRDRPLDGLGRTRTRRR